MEGDAAFYASNAGRGQWFAGLPIHHDRDRLVLDAQLHARGLVELRSPDALYASQLLSLRLKLVAIGTEEDRNITSVIAKFHGHEVAVVKLLRRELKSD